jgi:hypothetical protein
MATLTPNTAPGATILVKFAPGKGPAVKANMEALFNHPNVADIINGVGTIHYARWVLYDNDTKMLYTPIFDGDFEKYWADFLPYFQKYRVPPVFTLAEGWPADGFTNLESFQKFFRDHQVDSLGEWGSFDGATMQEVRQALRVNKAFQKVLDNPAAQKALQDPALKPLLDEASA